MPSGGPRTPRNPAPVSGPGPQSRRTDGGPGQKARYMSGGEYGEGQEMMNLQNSARMAQAPATPRPSAGGAASARPIRSATPLDAPSERPEEPLTMGSPVGAGAGPEILSGGMGSFDQNNESDLADMKAYLPSLIKMASQPGTPKSFVKFVRHLRDMNA